jgi:ribose 5-phosphate isomerase RpiB
MSAGAKAVIAATALGLAILLASPVAAHACATCFGAEDSEMTRGMNNAILLLLGVVGVVQGGFVALFVKFWRGARRRGASVSTGIEGG